MAALPLNLLTAALSQTGLTADPTAGTATAGQTDAVAGLFQSVLASAVTQATTAAVATQAEIPTDDAGTTDPLSQLLGLLEQAADDANGVNPDLLSQLLAALGANVQQLATPPTPPATDTVSTAVAVQTAAVSVELTAASATAANANPLLPVTNSTSATTTTQPASASATALANPQSVPVPTSGPVPTTATDVATVSQEVTVADANRLAGRVPAVVLQTPVAVDPSTRPPVVVGLTEAGEIQPPVTEPTPVKGPAPVAPSGSAEVMWTPPSEQQLAAISQAPTKTATTETATFNVPTATAQAATAQPLVLPATPQPTVRTRSDELTSSVSSVSSVVGTSVNPAIPTSHPQGVQPAGIAQQAMPVQPTAPGQQAAPLPVSASVRPASPEIAVTVAQPVDLNATRIDFGKVVGQPVFPLPIRADEPKTGESGTVVPAGAAAPPALANSTGAVAVDVMAPATRATPPVAEQLSGPIAAHLSTRPAVGETELRIRLDPPELGTVNLKIVSTSRDVRAELHVSSEAVRQVVESQLPELRQKLDDAVVRVQRFDVMADAGGGHAARDDRSDRWRPPPAELPPVARPRLAGAPPATKFGRIDVSV